MSSSWVTRWKYEVKLVKPCIYRLKTGGYLVRVQAGGQPRVRVLPDASLQEAEQVRLELRETVQNPERPLFQNFAVSLFKERVMASAINTAATRERWRETLEHYLIPEFGALYVDDVEHLRIISWKSILAGWIKHGKPSLKDPTKKVSVAPSTANGWMRVMSTICRIMTVRYNLPRNPFDGVGFFKEPPVYSEEEPNSLAPELMKQWLGAMLEKYPQHYALQVLGFFTGRRPGELRALVRTDVNWKKQTVTVRRSHGRGAVVENQTKTGRVVTVHLPKTVMDILRDHVAALPPGAMAKSPYLFPSTTGGIRSRSGLDKPFASICKELKIDFRVTPRAMRRSFQDLMRASGVEGLITRSISGHTTEKMQEHYSTVQPAEQRAALERAVEMVK